MIGLQVRHHFPGRIRFKVPALKSHQDIGDWVKQSLMAIQGGCVRFGLTNMLVRLSSPMNSSCWIAKPLSHACPRWI